MNALIVVVNFDVLEDFTSCLSLGFKELSGRKTFRFERTEEGFCFRIIVTVSPSAHAPIGPDNPYGRRNRLKILYWDGSGLWLCSKRLERGRFSWPAASVDQIRVQMSSEELTLLVSGIELKQTSKKEWYRRENGVEKAFV